MKPSSARPVNICTYQAKPGHEAELEALLAKHWPALREAGLASADPPQIFRGLPAQVPGDPHGAQGIFVEIFSWVSDEAPKLAHETPGVMAIWEPMGAICERMEFPSFVRLEGMQAGD